MDPILAYPAVHEAVARVAAADGRVGLLRACVRRGASLHDRYAAGQRALRPRAWLCGVPPRPEPLAPGVHPRDTLLCAAARNGRVGAVQWLLAAAGPDAGRSQSDGLHVPLVLAAEGGHAEVVTLLLAHGVRAGVAAALLAAAAGGHRACCTALAGAVSGAGFAEAVAAALEAGQRATAALLWCRAPDAAIAGVRAAAARSLDSVLVDAGARAWVLLALRWSSLQVAVDGRLPLEVLRLLAAGAEPRPAMPLARHRSTYAGAPAVCPATLEIMSCAARPWAPSVHCLYGPPVRAAVTAVLVAAFRRRRRRPSLPGSLGSVWLAVLSHLDRCWGAEGPLPPAPGSMVAQPSGNLEQTCKESTIY